MSAGWVAGVVRARAMGRRRLGRAAVRSMAAGQTFDDALAAVVASPYGHDVMRSDSLAEAQRAVGASLLWNLRVLAGWLPREGSDALRVLVGWFELANVDELLRSLAGAPAEPYFRMGTLATAWPQLTTATSTADLRQRLARSPWGDPGGDSRWEIQLGMRLVWADRVAGLGSPAADWAGGGAALLVARETLGRQRRLTDRLSAMAARLLGPGAVAARGIPDLTRSLPSTARWVMSTVSAVEDLWLAETRLWRRVEDDALGLARSSRFDFGPVIGAVALQAVDAWRVRAGLGLSARGGGPPEVIDAVV